MLLHTPLEIEMLLVLVCRAYRDGKSPFLALVHSILEEEWHPPEDHRRLLPMIEHYIVGVYLSPVTVGINRYVALERYEKVLFLLSDVVVVQLSWIACVKRDHVQRALMGFRL